MPQIRESDLPGIGRKFVIETRSGDQLIVVVHDEGHREIYAVDPGALDEVSRVATLDDAEARWVAGIIGGLAYAPRALDSVEVVLNGLLIEWYTIRPDAPCVGRTIGDLRIRQDSGATIIAIIEADGTKHINPRPERVLRAGATVVAVGERRQVRALQRQYLAPAH